eukprot:NODE_8244_length_714_cov_81.250423_g7990_i0.p1 GENE.NODE_8244_length_714_cov_81.250423_g7990_i0~~NODE_8244_length_714_cov_81.250423_g7990_i0.p1  ORF type:complete len:154 (+),score=18.74 NODE_8244_length_714_cov_81.250423_g7990_i0:69-530(+)
MGDTFKAQSGDSLNRPKPLRNRLPPRPVTPSRKQRAEEGQAIVPEGDTTFFRKMNPDRPSSRASLRSQGSLNSVSKSGFDQLSSIRGKPSSKGSFPKPGSSQLRGLDNRLQKLEEGLNEELQGRKDVCLQLEELSTLIKKCNFGRPPAGASSK